MISCPGGLVEDVDSVDHLHPTGSRPYRFLSQLLVVIAPDTTTKLQSVGAAIHPELTQFTHCAFGEQVAGCLCDFLMGCVHHDSVPSAAEFGLAQEGCITIFLEDTALLADCVIPNYVTFVESCLREFEIKHGSGNRVVAIATVCPIASIAWFPRC